MKSHKRGAPSGIKVKVASETRVELNNLKEELGLPSVDSVIQRLLGSFQLAEARFDAEPSPGGDRAERGKKRRVDVRKPLYSFELLAERRDMLEYYTGLDESAFRELLRRLQECAVVPADRRKSNEGHRKVDLENRLLMFLSRIKRKVPFQELGYQYGCGKASAKEYFDEMVELFVTHVVPDVVFPRMPSELKDMTRQEVAQKFSHMLAILDATNWQQLKPENFLQNRLSYSAYKHFNAF